MNCGTNLSKKDNKIICSKCGYENEKNNTYCEKCGTPLKNVNNTQPIQGIKIKRSTNPINKSIIQEKNVGLALILSIIPGIGLIYNTLAKRGVVVLLISIILFYINGFLFWLLWILQVVDTYLTLHELKDGEKPKLLGIIDLPEDW